ncbi:MAG: MerR family transcriptional regulator [Paracoccaceae bacterium]
MNKSPEAFRTISEVADWLDTPTHVLRFWESRFTQVKPVKRAGGRRYYRPKDMELLGGIKKLLHSDGMTIRGVQKLLREEGARHVATMSAPIDFGDVIDTTLAQAPIAADTATATAEIVVPLKEEPKELAPTEPPVAVEPELAAAAEPRRQPLLADVADDPAEESAAAPDTTDVAASLRSISRASAGQMPPSELLNAIYARLLHLRDRMNDGSGPRES